MATASDLEVIVTTESGSRYEFSANKVRRLSEGQLPTGDGDCRPGELRRDGDYLGYEMLGTPTLGEPMVLFLEPLGEGVATIRTTTPVTRLDWLD